MFFEDRINDAVSLPTAIERDEEDLFCPLPK